MAEASARREARRRRILENGDSRLEKIKNLQCQEHNVIESSTQEKVIEVEKVKPPKKLEPVLHEYEPEFVQQFEAIDNDNEPVILKLDRSTESNVAYNRVYIILMLGLAVRYLNLVFEKFEYLIGIDISFLLINKIFIPLLVYEVMDYYFNKPVIEVNVMFNLVLSLNNIRSHRVNQMLRIGNFVMFILKDVSIYFFSFLIIDVAFSFVSKNI